MQTKVSLWLEDAMAAASFLIAIALIPTVSLAPARKPAPVAPAVDHAEAPLLVHPLNCDAWVRQSGDGIETPRARCYFHKASK